MELNASAYPGMPVHDQAAAARAARRRTWLVPVVWVAALTLLGVAASLMIRRAVPLTSFSARVSMVYVPLGIFFILFVGWLRYPLAAAIFFGYLPIDMMASDTFFLAGDERGALTFGAVLALPLLVTGLLGPPAAGEVRSRHLPLHMVAAILGIVAAGFLATLLAVSVSVAAWALLLRIVLPVLVMAVTVRRLRGIGDYKTVWYGFLAGMLAIAVFDYRAIVFTTGQLGLFRQIQQRSLGATLSFSIPLVFFVGGLLWMTYGKAVRQSPLRAIPGIVLLGGIGVLFWLSATRGAILALGFLVAWWLLRTLPWGALRPRYLFLLVLAAVLITAVVVFSFERTVHDVGLVFERFATMSEQGITQEPRYQIWKAALGQWAERPLTGLGPNAWIVVNRQFASIHSTVMGILYDTGVFGFLAYGLFFASIFWFGRARYLKGLSEEDRIFCQGCRAGWIVMMLLLAVQLPITSGQPKNAILMYVALFYPILVMTVYARHGTAAPQPGSVPLLAAPVQPPYGTQEAWARTRGRL